MVGAGVVMEEMGVVVVVVLSINGVVEVVKVVVPVEWQVIETYKQFYFDSESNKMVTSIHFKKLKMFISIFVELLHTINGFLEVLKFLSHKS